MNFFKNLWRALRHKPLTTAERDTLAASLRTNAYSEGRLALLVGRDTSFAGVLAADGPELRDDSVDAEVIDTIKSVPVHYAGLSTLTATVSTEFKVAAAQVNLTGAAYNPAANSLDIRKNQNLSTAVSNTTTGGADQVFSFQQGVTAGSTVVLDLSALTDLLLRASPGAARVKAAHFRLLSAGDDSTISPAPTATSTCVITNNPPSTATMDQPCALDFGNGGSGLTLVLTVPSGAITAVAIGAAGSGYPKSSTFIVAPQQVSGSGAVIAVTTNSSGVPSTVALVAGAVGAGYTAATVPSVVLGQHFILTGGVNCYFDPAATGFSLIASGNKKIGLVNLDGTNAITVEVSLICGST